MSILDKFFPRARKDDPITSQQAAQEIRESAPKHMGIIHNCLREFGPMGKDRIGFITQMNPNQISRRLPEMQKMGMVELTGRTVMSMSGRQEREWRAL